MERVCLACGILLYPEDESEYCLGCIEQARRLDVPIELLRDVPEDVEDFMELLAERIRYHGNLSTIRGGD